MLPAHQPPFLPASHDSALLRTVEPVLAAAGSRASVVLSAEASLAAMISSQPPCLSLLDTYLPSIPLHQLLATTPAAARGCRLSIVLSADPAHQERPDGL